MAWAKGNFLTWISWLSRSWTRFNDNEINWSGCCCSRMHPLTRKETLTRTHTDFSYLCFLLDHSVLFLPHSQLCCFVLPQRPLFLQLWTPKCLNGVHRGAQLGLFSLQLKEIIIGHCDSVLRNFLFVFIYILIALFVWIQGGIISRRQPEYTNRKIWYH